MIIFGLKENLELNEEHQNDVDEGHMDYVGDLDSELNALVEGRTTKIRSGQYW